MCFKTFFYFSYFIYFFCIFKYFLNLQETWYVPFGVWPLLNPSQGNIDARKASWCWHSENKTHWPYTNEIWLQLMQNRSDRPQWPWNTRPSLVQYLFRPGAPPTLQYHTIPTPDRWSNLAHPHYHVHGHSFNCSLNPRPSLIQSVTVSHSPSHSLQMDTHSDDYPGLTSITPSICGGWTYEDSSSSYGWTDDWQIDNPQPYNRKIPYD